MISALFLTEALLGLVRGTYVDLNAQNSTGPQILSSTIFE